LTEKSVGLKSRFFLCAREISVPEGRGETIRSKNNSEFRKEAEKSQKLIIQKKSSKFQNRVCSDLEKVRKYIISA
jgi:hypothetical protein